MWVEFADNSLYKLTVQLQKFSIKGWLAKGKCIIRVGAEIGPGDALWMTDDAFVEPGHQATAQRPGPDGEQ